MPRPDLPDWVVALVADMAHSELVASAAEVLCAGLVDLPGVDAATVVARRRRRPVVVAASDDRARSIEASWLEGRHGPTVAALASGEPVQEDLGAAEGGSLHAAPIPGGPRSVLAVPLTGETTPPFVLTVHRHEALVGDEMHEQVAGVAALAGPVLAAVHRAEGLQQAVSSRHGIGLAQGMLMGRYGMTQQQAWSLLRRWSNESNLRVAELAEDVVRAGSRSLPHDPVGEGAVEDADVPGRPRHAPERAGGGTAPRASPVDES